MTQHKASFRILVATDNHLGFKESHHIRGDDSFNAFEEILSTAKENKVDFVLFGGDLFHEVTPSQGCLYRSMNIFKKYIFGGGELNFNTKGLSKSYEPNYLNENLNIDLPVFIIHGNHDYPGNIGDNVSSLDLLHASHLVNYIGKTPNLDEVVVEPILFEKGKIALYGLGHIKDTKLHYLLEKKKVKFVKPDTDDYMNILIIHQNRFKGIRVGAPYKSCVHPNMLPEFMDLVIWGNEHECCDELTQDPVLNFYIYQPGSSVATSLNQGEALNKHIGLFEIHEKKNFKFVPIPLKEQRPLLVKSVELDDLIGKNLQKKRMASDDANLGLEKIIEDRLEEEVLCMIDEFHSKNGINKKYPLPLVRLKVEYSGFDIIRIKQLEAKFMGKVANEGEVLKFWRKQTPKKLQNLRNNEKLNEKFEDCLKQKMSFETLTSDSTTIISELFEDLMKSSSQKPRVLANYSMFTQNSGQKFTLQNLTSQIAESLNFATGNLLAKKTQELSQTSTKIKGLQEEYIQNRMERTEEYQSAVGDMVNTFEKQIETLPYYLTTKLQDYSNSKISNVLPKQEVIEEVKQDTQKPTIQHRLAFGPSKDDLFMDSDEEIEEKSSKIKKRIVALKKNPENKAEYSSVSTQNERENEDTSNLKLKGAQKTKRQEGGSSYNDLLVAVESKPTVDMTSVTPLSDFLKKFTSQNNSKLMPTSGAKKVKKMEFKSPETNSMGVGGNSNSKRYGPYFS